jgi:hypothetical protein
MAPADFVIYPIAGNHPHFGLADFKPAPAFYQSGNRVERPG